MDAFLGSLHAVWLDETGVTVPCATPQHCYSLMAPPPIPYLLFLTPSGPLLPPCLLTIPIINLPVLSAFTHLQPLFPPSPRPSFLLLFLLHPTHGLRSSPHPVTFLRSAYSLHMSRRPLPHRHMPLLMLKAQLLCTPVPNQISEFRVKFRSA